MNRIAKFEKVSYEQFKKDWIDTFESYRLLDDNTSENMIRVIYDSIRLPKRATSGSAGYDFFSPIDLNLSTNETIKIPTGIKCKMDEDMVLMIFPRSGLGSKFRFVPCNLVGIVDADYVNSDNEGHIFMKMTNDGDKTFDLGKGKAFCQGILLQYFTTIDDDVKTERNGGFGSTDKNPKIN